MKETPENHDSQGEAKMAGDAEWRDAAMQTAMDAFKAGDWNKARAWWEASKCNDAAARGMKGLNTDGKD